MELKTETAIKAIEKGLDFIKTLGPVATSLGGDNFSKYVATASAVVGIAKNVQENIELGKLIASETDQTKINDLISEISAENDRFSQIIASM